MSRYVYSTILVLLIAIPLLGIPYEQTEEYAQKQAFLNERAARFKAETGFEGSIAYNYQTMTFSSMIGNFKGIEIATPQDTTAMQLIFTQLVSIISPYLAASKEDLQYELLLFNERRSTARYRQIINGYEINGSGWLSISYMIELNKILVTDSTVPIRTDSISPSVKRERALKIYQDSIAGEEDKLSLPVTPVVSLKYYDVNQHTKDLSPNYRLCWIISGYRFIVLDAVSETVYINRPSYVVHNRSYK